MQRIDLSFGSGEAVADNKTITIEQMDEQTVYAQNSSLLKNPNTSASRLWGSDGFSHEGCRGPEHVGTPFPLSFTVTCLEGVYFYLDFLRVSPVAA